MSNLRYEVRDEWGGIVRRFYTMEEAELYIQMDKSLWIKVLPKPAKTNPYAIALAALGTCLL